LILENEVGDDITLKTGFLFFFKENILSIKY